MGVYSNQTGTDNTKRQADCYVTSTATMRKESRFKYTVMQTKNSNKAPDATTVTT